MSWYPGEANLLRFSWWRASQWSPSLFDSSIFSIFARHIQILACHLRHLRHHPHYNACGDQTGKSKADARPIQYVFLFQEAVISGTTFGIVTVQEDRVSTDSDVNSGA